jgi:acetoin utilization protein AcuB
MFVEEVMSVDPYAATVTSSVRQVLQMLSEADVRHLPIVDDGTLVGIVSDRDLRGFLPSATAELEQADSVRRLLSQPIANLMSTNLVLLNPQSELGEAVDLLIEHRIGAIPVVEPDSLKLVGIVSYIDVLRAAREFLE